MAMFSLNLRCKVNWGRDRISRTDIVGHDNPWAYSFGDDITTTPFPQATTTLKNPLLCMEKGTKWLIERAANTLTICLQAVCSAATSYLVALKKYEGYVRGRSFVECCALKGSVPISSSPKSVILPRISKGHLSTTKHVIKIVH